MNIKPKSFFFSAVVVLQGSTLLLNALFHDGIKNNLLAFLVAAVISVLLLCQSEADDIFSLSHKVLKTAGGKILSIIYVIYFVTAAAFNINLLSYFVGGYILEKTPRAIFIFVFTTLCAYGAHKGKENLFRLSVLFFAVAVISCITDTFMLKDEIDFNNFTAEINIKSILVAVALLLGDMLVFSCFPRKKEKIKSTIWGFIAGSMLLGIIIFRSTATLGNMTSVFTWPTHETLRVINTGNTHARVEILSAFVMMAMVFFKTSMLYCCAVDGIKKVFGINKSVIPVMFCRTTIFFTALFMFNSGERAMKVWAGEFSIAIILILALLPVVLNLINSKRKKL